MKKLSLVMIAVACVLAVGLTAEAQGPEKGYGQPNSNLGPPANDACAAPIPIGCGDVVAFSTVGATVDGPPPTCGVGDNNEIWYEITGNGGDMTFSTCDDADYDTRLVAHDGCGGAEVACNDDQAPCTGFTSIMTFTSVNATVYSIGVGGFSGAVGSGNLTVTCDIPAELTSFDVE